MPPFLSAQSIAQTNPLSVKYCFPWNLYPAAFHALRNISHCSEVSPANSACTSANCVRLANSASLGGDVLFRGILVTICLPFLTWKTWFPNLPRSIISAPLFVIISITCAIVLIFYINHFLSCWICHFPTVAFFRRAVFRVISGVC